MEVSGQLYQGKRVQYSLKRWPHGPVLTLKTLWTKEKPLVTAGNQSMIPWLSSTYCSPHTMNCATLPPTDTAFCLLAKNIHTKLFGHTISTEFIQSLRSGNKVRYTNLCEFNNAETQI